MAPDQEQSKPETIRVRATARGYFGFIREPGDVFTFKDPAAFHSSWMERVDEDGNAVDERGKVIPSEVRDADGQLVSVHGSGEGQQAQDEDGGGSHSADVAKAQAKKGQKAPKKSVI